MADDRRFTTAAGVPVADNTNIMTAGPRGPALLQDVWLIGKLAHSYRRDGAMRTDGNLGGTKTYHPNSDGLRANQPDFAEPPMPVDGDGAHWDHRIDDDHWEQPGNLFRMMSPAQQLLFGNTARAMGDAALPIKQRHVDNCTRADPAYGAGVAATLGLTA